MPHAEQIDQCAIPTRVKDLEPGDVFVSHQGPAMNIPQVVACLPVDATGMDPLDSMRGMYAVIRQGDTSVQPVPGDRTVYRRARPGVGDDQ